MVQKYSNAEHHTAVKLFKGGFTASEIAQKINRTESSVRCHLNKYGFYFSERKKELILDGKQHKEISDLIKKGYSVSYVSEAYGFDKSKLSDYLKRFGIVPQPKSNWTHDRIIDLQELVKQGKTVQNIAEHFNIKENTVKAKMCEIFGTSIVKKAQKVIRDYGGSVL